MNLISNAHENGVLCSSLLSRAEQKELGQFMTPPSIAKAMAARSCVGVDQAVVRVLDPAAGTGILAAAVVEELLLNVASIQEIQVVLFETDARLHLALNSLARRMRRAGQAMKVSISISIRIEDFLLSDVSVGGPQFHVIIANPPYFKLRKSDLRAVRHAYAVHGQPNIYGLFMAACARLLAPGGRWCFITPRSWTNGPYFALARRHMLAWLHVDAIHVFESRQDHFTDDEVLQEAMITWATAQSANLGSIIVSTSKGVLDIDDATLRVLPAGDVIGVDSENVISLPTLEGSEAMRSFTATLSTYGIKVSTGPVVAFRAGEHIAMSKSRGSVPLLWMQHISHMRISWPISKKREHITASKDSAWMLVPNVNMVVMRRFSPKEDRRRVTAAPYIEDSLPGAVLGLENHTNYLYRPGGSMSRDEVKGIAAYLNSRFVDQYLRAVSGNTQVNASDLKNLPVPAISHLIAIGRLLPEDCSLETADEAVDRILGKEKVTRIA